MDKFKFIDSCVGNIARKIEDEFNESDHPRDKGGKFTSKGGEGRGGAREYVPELFEEDDEDFESEESESGVEDIQESLRRNVASSVEDLLEYTKDDGYDAELVSDEFMIVRKDDKEYRAHIDRAGSSYYVDRVEEW